jgi:hypothetical protein
MGAGYTDSFVLSSVPEADHASSDGRCDDCEECHPEMFFCNACELSLCSECWDAQLAHRKKKLGPGGTPHEKTELRVAEKIHQVFTPRADDAFQSRLFTDEEDNCWFGRQQWLCAGQGFTLDSWPD